ncbi:MAG: hypothetical protein F4236_06240 [Acidimicrobiia bacterium]|nr:hypothetical protein [Acidimicrobiia bacterium]MYB25119.1 hypothetical protein [Acidimicrobiia bacterium]MYE67740.1 hypothetical protein [Acidimicrobiia bacterium]MYJ14385.1 hypothetical protein [Acidimicrobiia bacterium]
MTVPPRWSRCVVGGRTRRARRRACERRCAPRGRRCRRWCPRRRPARRPACRPGRRRERLAPRRSSVCDSEGRMLFAGRGARRAPSQRLNVPRCRNAHFGVAR